jgi:hypothetical protein
MRLAAEFASTVSNLLSDTKIVPSRFNPGVDRIRSALKGGGAGHERLGVAEHPARRMDGTYGTNRTYGTSET